MTRAAICGLTALLACACLVDLDDRCSKNQKLTTDDAGCVCIEGHVPAADNNGCEPCGDNEVVAGVECVCAEGFQPDPDGVCAASGFGHPCTIDDDCIGADVDLCRDDSCTASCGASAPCPPYWWCRDDAVVTGIQSCAQPTGMGEVCETNDNCTGDAGYCAFNPAEGVARCALTCVGTPEICEDLGIMCCDLTAFIGTQLCVAPSECPVP